MDLHILFRSSHQFLEVLQKVLLLLFVLGIFFLYQSEGSNQIHKNSIKKYEIWHGGQLAQIFCLMIHIIIF